MDDMKNKKVIPTLNHMGYMTTSLDKFSDKFIKYAAEISEPVLEIGAAYGVATITALKAGAIVIANDIEPRHLEILERKVPTNLRHNLKLCLGRFPEDLDFPEESLSGALICNVFHFFEGERIELALTKLYGWLKPRAKIFVVADTPYNRLIEKAIPEYEISEKGGVKWPGFMKNIRDYLPPEYMDISPPFMHFLTPKILSEILIKIGFKVEEAEIFARTNYPLEEQLDGREGVGVIAIK